jgi:DNA-directed RNA polymerase subunit RPC12/RpoP
MAMVKCSECGRAVSDKAAACPNCGAPRSGKAKAPAVTMGPIRRGLQWVWYGLVSLMVFSCVYQWNKPREPRAFGEADARILCSDAIRAASRDREKAEIPFVPATTRGDEISMSWNDGTGTLRLRNGLGLDVPASASCVVSKSQKRVTILTINGQTII